MNFWRELHPTTRRLLAARAARSIAQGALVADLALYLHALGWSGLAIGLVLTGGGLSAAGLSVAIGIFSDRYRRKPFLIVNEIVTLACGLAPLLTADTAILATVIVIAGFGRGMNGAAGPFAPAEQAWLAQVVEPEKRGWVYSFNNALGFFGMAAGSLAAMLPGFWVTLWSPRTAYAIMFLLVIAGSLANLWLLMRATESPPGKSATVRLPRRHVQRRENHILWRLMQLNALNGLSMGLTGPLIAYWFALKFHTGPDAIAPVLAATFALTGAMALYTGRLAQRHSLTRLVVWTRGAGVVLLALLPIMPWFWLAAVIYMLRLASGGASVGARQAQILSLIRNERRGLAASVNAASFQVPQSAGPGIAGPLIAAGFFMTPFYVAAVLQFAYVAGYGRVFGRYERFSVPDAENKTPR